MHVVTVPDGHAITFRSELDRSLFEKNVLEPLGSRSALGRLHLLVDPKMATTEPAPEADPWLARFDATFQLEDPEPLATYIESDCNATTRLATSSWLENDSTSPRFLLIRGKSGIGKTEILRQTTAAMRALGKKILFCKAGHFGSLVTELISGGRHDLLSHLRSLYVKCHGLVIDDAQMVPPKYKLAQEELVRLIHSMVTARKPVLLSSSDNRLDEVFSDAWLKNLIQQCASFTIQPPDAELIDALVTRDLHSQGITLSSACLQLLTKNHASAVQPVLNAFSVIGVHSKRRQMHHWDDVELLRDILAREVAPQPLPLSKEAITAAVEKEFNYNRQDLLSPKRQRGLIEARHVLIYLYRTEMGRSYPEIGQWTARTHASCMHAHKKMAQAVATGAPIAATIRHIQTQLRKHAERG